MINEKIAKDSEEINNFEYAVISHDSPNAFSRIVNQHLEQGWTFYTELKISSNNNRMPFYIREMIRRRKDTD